MLDIIRHTFICRKRILATIAAFVTWKMLLHAYNSTINSQMRRETNRKYMAIDSTVANGYSRPESGPVNFKKQRRKQEKEAQKKGAHNAHPNPNRETKFSSQQRRHATTARLLHQ